MFRRSVLVALLCACMFLPSVVQSKEELQRPGPVHLDKSGEKWARKSLKKMTLEQKVGQMFIIWAHAEFLNVNSAEYKLLRDQMHKYHIGGFGLTVRYDDGLLFKNEPLEAAMLTNQLQRDSEFPLIFAADFERGLGMRLNGATTFPHAMAIGATGNVEYARESGRITAQEARAIGVQWNWFPDADVNSNPLNPIINTRSFGEDPNVVSEMVTAYIEGSHQYGMLTTAKHFPGHGDTATDSHSSVAQVTGGRAHLDNDELPPFRAAIKAGVDAILVAHVQVPALDPVPNHVASTSPAIETGLLKQQMGFKGLVITDGMGMSGLMEMYPEGGKHAAARAAVDAVKAGNDVLLLPPDLDAAYNGVLQAVRSGEIPESRIDESVLKILRAKASVGLNKAKFVDIDAVNQVVARPESLAAAQKIADSSITLVRDNQQILPLRPARPGTYRPPNPYQGTGDARGLTLTLIFVDDVRSDSGRLFADQVRARVPAAQVIYIDPRNAAAMNQMVVEAAERAANVIAAVYEVPTAGKALGENPADASDTLQVEGAQSALLRSVLKEGARKTVVVAMGNPYMATPFPGIETYLCAYSNTQVSEISAVKAIFGEIPTKGHLPVSIPNFASRGAGLLAPSQPSSGGSK